MLLWHALVHNLMRMRSLNIAFAARIAGYSAPSARITPAQQRNSAKAPSGNGLPARRDFTRRAPAP